MAEDSGKAPRGRVSQASTQGAGKPAGDGRRRSMSALGANVERVTRQVLGKRALAEASLIAEWPSVVGQDFARACQPRRLVFPDRKARREATLVLRVKSGEATRLAHLEPVLIDRVNGFFGYQAVKRLKLEQGQLVDRTPAPRPRPQPTLDDSESRAARERIAGIEDTRLRDALNRLSDRLSGAGSGGRSDGGSTR
ncbi:hypothetical protein CKO28_18095 [Rhodovibrio sodomensis]|uniref:DUF721 domain-containing protein n=1 Tax=Rhodovibrio sodomensis TaxID=1088 RepID=A0ABS1DJK2_9PROT|nr:DciA family protein [Rhodovibrio sodomensis]MBK1669949.1 hypothetical protein [Rhodovibrio sodomensis]